MAHRSIEALEFALKAAADKVIVGGHYAHYKHPDVPYIVTGISILEATDEVAVRYASPNYPAVEFVRPLTSWLESVTYNGRQVNRFTQLV